MNQRRISVIVTTRNNHETLDACLRSIARQAYPQLELIVVDNYSTDDTVAIARRYTPTVFRYGPERSTQRNYGVKKATGSDVLIVDSDMVLGDGVVAACAAKMTAEPGIKALIIPEESFGKGFWAHCKQLERSFYVGQDSIEAARCFDRALYERLGGYNEALTGGEDWDLTNRVRAEGAVARIAPFIFHNEGQPRFTRTVRKMYYYAQHAVEYFAANPTQTALTNQSGPLARYKLFFSRPGKLFKDPLLGLGMLTLKTAEYAAAGFGYMQAKRKTKQQKGVATNEA